MQFLKTLFWVVLAVTVVLFARENWVPVEVKLWSGLIAEVKLPFLLLIVLLLGFLPTYLFYRGRMWSVQRQMTRPGRVTVANQPAAAASVASDQPSGSEERQADLLGWQDRPAQLDSAAGRA